MDCLSIPAIPACASWKTILCILIEFIDLYLFIRLLFFPGSQINIRSTVAQNDYHGCLATKQGEIPTALVTGKTENTNHPESPQRHHIKLQSQDSSQRVMFKCCVMAIKHVCFPISANIEIKAWRSIWFSSLLSAPGTISVSPCSTAASVTSRAPSSASGRASLPSRQRQPPPKFLRMLGRRGTGTQRGSSVTTARLGTKTKKPPSPSIHTAKPHGLEFSILLARRGRGK